MATYTFQGTKVTGTSEKDFKIPGAKRNNTYLNTQTGHVYICTEVHTDWQSPGWSRWRYTRTDIIAKPNQGVFGLGAPVRNGDGSRVLAANWTLYDWQRNEKNGKRMTGQRIIWSVNRGDANVKYTVAKELPISTTTEQFNLGNFPYNGNNLTRASFHPLVPGRTIASVSCSVMTKNTKGNGPTATSTRKLYPPRKPVLSGFEFNDTNGKLSITVTSDPGTDDHERYDTWCKMTVLDTSVSKTPRVIRNSASTETTIPLEYDAENYDELRPDDYIRVDVEAWSRGYAGDSAHVKATYYISVPAPATITKASITSRDSTGKCTVSINPNSTTEHPVDGVKLEYLPNVTYASAAEIPGDADWRSTNITDDAKCTALSVAVTELIPDRGRYTWLRVKSWHATENRLYRFSDYISVLHEEAPTAEDDDITIISAEASGGGDSITVLLGWNADGLDDATGTELSWSDEENSWKSTKAPESYTFTWSDHNPVTHKGVVYQDSAEIVIKGLKEGTQYYIKARRYFEGDVTTYSDYSNTATCITSEIPETIVASCDKFVAAGSPLPVYWTFSGNGIQNSWRIRTVEAGSDEGAHLAEGEGSAGFTQIPAERLETHAVDNTLTFVVEAATGSAFVSSEAHTVTIVDTPELAISAPSQLTAQPFSFTAQASALCDLVVVVSSEGAITQHPTGIIRQTLGDTIHSELYAPAWVEEGTGFATTITLPEGLDFWDGGRYILSVTAIDRDTGLNSDESQNSFAVAWAHKAVDPFEAVTLIPIDETDDTGRHRKAVEIALTAPEGAANTDVFDIYRLNGDGAQLIGEGFPPAYTAVDEYAPFGRDLTLYYRIALRTADGDIAYSDFEYTADGNYLRFDWDDYSLELPYNIELVDSYKKDVDIRQHMDGTSDGYWNANVERKGALNTDIIRLRQPTEIILAKQLARYPGVVFVRTPDGGAYEADVQVSNMSTKNSAVTAVAIDATEVGLTKEFMLPTPFGLENEEP